MALSETDKQQIREYIDLVQAQPNPPKYVRDHRKQTDKIYTLAYGSSYNKSGCRCSKNWWRAFTKTVEFADKHGF